MELGFLLMLDEDELRAALAHELGHVWIYTHHPFLQTERMANVIGQRVTGRAALEKVYMKLWAYERTAGVPLEDLLGPPFSS
jgi:predicted Zn-dependent protease